MFLAGRNKFGEAARHVSHDHRPNPLRVARIASLEGGVNMSRKPSTAALDSFRRSSFPTRRRAPRHPAGENIRSSAPTVSSQFAMNSHPENSSSSRDLFVIPEIYCHPERSEGSAFRTTPNSRLRTHSKNEAPLTRSQISITQEEAMNCTITNRPSLNVRLTLPALLRAIFALLLLLLGVAHAPSANAQTKSNRIVITYPVNRANAENLQRWVNTGHDTWCRDPKLVAAHTLEQFAPDLADSAYELASQPVVRKLSHDRTAIYTYHSLDGQTTYRLTLIRPQWLRPVAGSLRYTVWLPTHLEILTDSIID